MSVETAPRDVTAYDEWRERRWQVAGRLLVLLVVAIGVAALLTGEKQSTYGDLVGAVADGDVMQVQAYGLPDGDGWTGTTTAVLRWREVVTHYAEVRIVRGGAAGDAAASEEAGRVTREDPRRAPPRARSRRDG